VFIAATENYLFGGKIWGLF